VPWAAAVVTGPEGTVVAANDAWRRLAGARSAAGVPGLAQLFPTASAAAAVALKGGAAAGGLSLRLVPLGGPAADAKTWWDLDLAPHAGTPGALLVTAREVTEEVPSRREAADARMALEAVAARLRLAQEAAGIGTWEWDARADRLAWSPEQYRLHGMDPARDRPPRLADWLARVHPDDLPALRAAAEGRSCDAAGSYQVEFRLRRADTGAWRWLLSRGRVAERDAEGRPARIVGVNLDVTEQRGIAADAGRPRAAPDGAAPAPARCAARARWRPGLRAHLLLLVLAVLVPTLIFAALLSWQGLRRHDEAAEARLLDTAQAMAMAVDAQIGARIVALQVLAGQIGAQPEEASTRLLDQARATAEVFGGWITLSRRDGSQILNTGLAAGVPLPGPGGAPEIARVFATGQPAVGDIGTGRASGQLRSLVHVPAMRDGVVTAVFAIALPPEQLAETLRSQAAGGAGGAALTDSRRVFAARTRDPALTGQPRPARPGDRLDTPGVLRATRLATGEPVRAAFHPLATAPGWHAWVNEPEGSFIAARRTALLPLAGVWALTLVLGLAGAALVARRLLRPVEALVGHAELVARGGAGAGALPAIPAVGVAEFERLREAVAAAEAALREGEARLAALFLGLPVAVAIVDTAGRVVASNPAMARYVPGGLLPARDEARHGRWRGYDAEGRRIGRADYPGMRALRGETVLPGTEFLYLGDDGVDAWTRVAAVPVRDAAGGVAGAFVVCTDIDAPKRAGIAAERRAARDAALAEVAREALAGDLDEATLAEAVFTRVGPLLGADIGFNHRLAEAEGALHLVAARGIAGERLDGLRRLGLGQAFCGMVAETCMPLAADAARIAADERGALLRGFGLRAYAGHPLRGEGGRLLGTLSFGSTARDGFEAEEVAFLQSVCDLVALAWARARAEAARSAGEARYRALVEAGTHILWVNSADGRYERPNPHWEAFTGQSFEAARGHGWMAAIHPDDRPRTEAAWHAAVATRSALEVEHRLRRHDGAWRWMQVRVAPVHGAGGAILEWVGSNTDVTERVDAQAALAGREAQYRALFASIDEGYCLCEIVTDAEGRPVDYRFLEVNPLFETFTGLQDAVGRTARGDLVPGLEPHWAETYGRVALGGETLRFEAGSEAMGRVFDVFATPVVPRGRFAIVFKDITERRRAEALRSFRLALSELLRDARDPLAAAAEAAALLGRHLRAGRVGFAEVEEDGAHIVVRRDWTQDGMASVAGRWRMDDFGPAFIRQMKAGATIAIADVADDPRTNAPEVLPAFAGIGTRAILDVPLLREGQQVALLFVHHPEPHAWSAEEIALAEETCRLLWATAERAHAEARLRRALDELAGVYAAAPVGLCVLDTELRFLRVNERLAEINGVPMAAHIGRTVREVLPGLSGQAEALLRRVLETGEPQLDVEITGETPARPGVPRIWREDWLPLRDHEGRIVGISIAAEEVTERRAAETALAESEARFRALVDSMPQFAFTATPDGRLDFANRQWFAYTGQTEEQALPSGAFDALHPEDRARALAAWQDAVATGGTFESEHRVRSAEGTHRRFLARATPLRDGEGRILKWFMTCTDISEIVAARELAARSAEELERLVVERTRALSDAARELEAEIRRREEAQSALLQAQKLDALGQLTGSVAHDFNNLLAAVQGGYRLLERRIGDNPRAAEIIRQGQHAAERGARLIAGLMAFARKEEMRPVPLDPVALLRRAGDLVRHTVGEQVHCIFDLPAGCPPVIADPARMETVLLNLATNARDAMADGGTLTVALRVARPEEVPPDLPAGRDWVLLSVTDTGRGMDAETLRRATEPFFTTKAPGQGTGLGLASAHAFATGSGGTLRLRSAPAAGATVEIFLPRAAVQPTGLALTAPAQARHGGARILVVDDDDGVRPVTADVLRGLGYDVVEAASAEAAEALALAEGAAPVDMLVTDVVMGGAPGPVLAARLRAERPGLPVLYITGYPGRHDVSDAPVLRKPFTDADLAEAVLRGLGRAG
jgi:PAS domain S-box-containing protein